MDTPPIPPSNSSWQKLLRHATTETPPEIDVRFSVRQQIQAEFARKNLPAVSPTLLDEIAALIQARWGLAATAAALVLACQFFPAIREVALALEFQSDLLAGL